MSGGEVVGIVLIVIGLLLALGGVLNYVFSSTHSTSNIGVFVLGLVLVSLGGLTLKASE